MSDYEITIFYIEEDGGYIADIPELQYCSAFGTSPQEALAQVLKARQLWLEEAKAQGRAIPAPVRASLLADCASGLPLGRSQSKRASPSPEVGRTMFDSRKEDSEMCLTSNNDTTMGEDDGSK
ncbi:MAG: type II toxin-antitoxin system HicB family antitoxin [Actinomycetota bacterium]